MGTLRTYKCNKCSYSNEISGGSDVGFIIKTNAMLCDLCKEVVDVVTRYWTNEQPDESDIGKCPKCNLRTHIREWDNKKRPCPKCDGKLDVDENGSIVMGD